MDKILKLLAYIYIPLLGYLVVTWTVNVYTGTDTLCKVSIILVYGLIATKIIRETIKEYKERTNETKAINTAMAKDRRFRFNIERARNDLIAKNATTTNNEGTNS